MHPRLLRVLTMLLACVAALALAGCTTGYPGGYGGYPDSGYGSQRIVGTVQFFDPGSGQLVLVDENARGYGQPDVTLWADRGTRLFYQGRELAVAGLEPGDRVSVEVEDDGRRLRARTVEVIQNVRDSSGGYGAPYPGTYPGPYRTDPYGNGGAATLEGAVRYVDTGRRAIEITRGGYAGSVERIFYDPGTRFYYQGRAVRPDQLENGVIVRIEGRRRGQDWYADSVTVTVNARSR